MTTAAKTPPGSVPIAFAMAAAALVAWIAFTGSQGGPEELRVSNVAWSRTGRWLAAGTSHGRITLWGLGSGAAPRQIAFSGGSLNDLQFSPDERTLAIAARDLGLYACEGPAGVRRLRADGRNYGTVRFSRDGQTVLTITGTGAIETLDARSGAARLHLCCSTIYGEVAFTPDWLSIAGAGHWPSLWDARSGGLIARLTKERQSATFRAIAFDGPHGTVWMGSQDGRVYGWDLAARQLITTSPAQPEYVDTIAVTAAGWVAYAGFGRILRLWNPRTGETRSLPAACPTSNLVVGPDGTSVLFGTAGGEIEFWDADAGKRIRVMRVP